MSSPAEIRAQVDAKGPDLTDLRTVKSERETVGNEMKKWLAAYGNREVSLMKSHEAQIKHLEDRMTYKFERVASRLRNIDTSLKNRYENIQSYLQKGATGLASTEVEQVGRLLRERERATRTLSARLIGITLTDAQPPKPSAELLNRFPSLKAAFSAITGSDDLARGSIRPALTTPSSAAGLDFGTVLTPTIMRWLLEGPSVNYNCAEFLPIDKLNYDIKKPG